MVQRYGILEEHRPAQLRHADHGENDMNHREPTTDADLEKLQHQSFNYFLYEANAANELVIDKTARGR